MPTPSPSLHCKSGHSFLDAFASARTIAPDAFGSDRLANLWDGQWHLEGETLPATTPVDGSGIVGPPMLTAADAQRAMDATVADHATWSTIPLAERKARVREAITRIDAHRELIALLLVWEIGKPWSQSLTSVDRTVEGVEWYCDEIDAMLDGRRPLAGPVSNIASWNYPLSVLVHAMLVQALAGNAVIAKSPTDGGVNALTLAVALAAEEGLPFSLVSGGGRELSPVLVNSPQIGCVSFVGGRDTGGQIATQLTDTDRRHMLEQEGLNTWGIWKFSDWDRLAAEIRKGFAYGKQRCTAYPRYVVQRGLFDQFLAMYLPVLSELRFGHPLAVASDNDPLPELDFGPLINAAKVTDLTVKVDDAIHRGAVPLFRGSLDDGAFLPGQNRDAYLAPVALYDPPRSSALHHAEPFGPVDSVIVVDTEADLLAAMNASNGALVSSVACDDEATASRLAADVQAFKVGINKSRSRGDKAEPFGGRGASWRGAFVGGELLVHAVTEGPEGERLYGNFPDYRLEPQT